MSRAATTILGIVIAPVVIAFAATSVWAVVHGVSSRQWLWLIGALVSLFPAWWLLSVTWRMILGRPRREGGLFSPLALRAVAILLAALPVLSLAMGAWRTTDVPVPLLVLQAFAYCLGARGLWRMAASRSASARLDGAPNRAFDNDGGPHKLP